MRTNRMLVVAGATILSLAALAPVVAASARSGELSVTKSCATYAGAANDYCTITSSNLNAIKAGTRVIYLQAANFATLTLDSNIVIDGPGNNNAFGHVTLDLVTGTGTVTISGGTGVFSGFDANVAVAPLGGGSFAWHGSYEFTPGS
jgi:hypothetical protein